MVERLRADGLTVSSFVAKSGGSIVGHTLFSDLHVTAGIGSLLVRAGLDDVPLQGSRCRARPWAQ